MKTITQIIHWMVNLLDVGRRIMRQRNNCLNFLFLVVHHHLDILNKIQTMVHLHNLEDTLKSKLLYTVAPLYQF